MWNLSIAKIKIHIENTIFFLLWFDEFAYGRCARTQRQYKRIEWNGVNARKKTTIKEAYEFNYRYRHTTLFTACMDYGKMSTLHKKYDFIEYVGNFLALAIVQNHIQSLFMVELTFRFLSFSWFVCLSVFLSACLLTVFSVRQTLSGVFSILWPSNAAIKIVFSGKNRFHNGHSVHGFMIYEMRESSSFKLFMECHNKRERD